MILRRSLVVALASLLAACGNGAAPVKHAAVPPAPTPTPSRPAPALVQVENSPDARPHSGLQKADMVFEYLTEGGITRFSAIYLQPGGNQHVEPVRSARLAALRLSHSYGAVLFYSGASDHVLGMVWDQKIPNYDDRSDGGRYFARDSSRYAPHNLYTTPDQMAQAIRSSGKTVIYNLPPRVEPPTPGDAPVNKLAFQQTYAHSVAYSYDGDSKTYQYTSETGPMVDQANGGQPLQIASVVLLQVPHHGAGYTEDVNGQEGIDFDLQGQGRADVYTRGQHFPATWDLSDPNQPLRILGADGNDLPLPPGLTWIHLVDPGMAVSTA
jgi:DUF3048 family protein